MRSMTSALLAGALLAAPAFSFPVGYSAIGKLILRNSYDPDAVAYFADVVARGGAELSGKGKRATSNYIRCLKAGDVWQITDRLVWEASENRIASTTDMRAHGKYWAEFGTPAAWVALQGFTGDWNGTTGTFYLSAIDNLAASANLTPNGGFLAAYVTQAGTPTVANQLGTVGTGNWQIVTVASGSGNGFRLNSASAVTGNFGARTGLYLGVRTDSTTIKGYRFPSTSSTPTVFTNAALPANSATLPSEPIVLFRRTSAYSADRQAMAAYGGTLTDTQALALRECTVAYGGAMGVPLL